MYDLYQDPVLDILTSDVNIPSEIYHRLVRAQISVMVAQSSQPPFVAILQIWSLKRWQNQSFCGILPSRIQKQTMLVSYRYNYFPFVFKYIFLSPAQFSQLVMCFYLSAQTLQATEDQT